MRYLLDTQAVLWLFDSEDRWPDATRQAVSGPAETALVSSVVAWEIAIKASRGKLEVRDDFLERLDEYGFARLPITDAHAWRVRDLPWHHRDPFDRLLVAQAMVEDAVLVSADPVLARYDVDVLWD